MGISGLLPVLKSITETKTIDQYRGQTLAIDGYCWLHRAIYSCSQEICLGEDTDKYIVYFIDRVNALLQHGVTPYVVFDGGPLPMKKGTEEERRKSREKNRALGIECLRQKKFADARKHFVRGADVSPYMAHCVIRRLRQMKVQYVVAPYEADAQLAFLMKNGLVDGVITEDSDCLPFGCTKVLFKMDRDGVAQEVRTANLKRNDGLSFHMFTDDMFLEMCIFSGCDYLPSLSGFGLKKAYALMKQHGSYTKILRALRMEGKVCIPATYEAEFERAVLTFHHQRVYDPQSKQLVPLTPIPQDLLDKHAAMDFLGPIIAQELAQGIAEGDVDPITQLPFTDPPPSRPQNAPVPRPPSTFNSRPQQSGFIHRKTPVFKSPPKAAPPPVLKTTNRNLPAWMSRKVAEMNAKTPSPPPAPAATKASTPKTISHFFAARQANCSPTDDAAKTSAVPPPASLSRQPSTDSSTFESQDPSEVDVARSISFSPLNDEVKQMRCDGATSSDKENAAPNEAAKPASTENAFARMMRAGTMLQKHTLKRKASLSGFSHSTAGRFGVAQKRQETPMERIKRLAFTSPSSTNQPEAEPASATQRSSPSPTECTQEPEPEPEPLVDDSPSDSASQPCIARSAMLSGETVAVEKSFEQTQTRHDSHRPKTDRSPASVDVFARFRFGTK